MTDRIRAHIDALFQSAPNSDRVRDAREELLAGCLDKYADLTAQGRPPEEAYRAVISGVGDVDELLRAIGQLDTADPRKEQTHRKRRALFIAAGIFLYVLSVAVYVIIDSLVDTSRDSNLAGAVFLMVAAAATLVLVFGVLSTRVKVPKPSVSLTGEIQAQMAGGGKDDKLRSALSSSMWSLMATIYLCAGLFLGLWHPGWLLFPFGAILQSLISMAFSKPGQFRLQIKMLIWTLCTFLYLAVSVLTGAWGVTWLFFPLALSVQQMMKLARVWRDSQ